MYNWSDYVAPENMEAFKAEYGVKNFVYDTFANNEELLAKLAGGSSGYDFACPTAEFMPQMAEEGYIQKLDYSRIPNFQYIDPAILEPGVGPEQRVPHPEGPGHDRHPVPLQDRHRAAHVLARVLRPCGRQVQRQDRSWSTPPATSWSMPLKMLGYSLNSTDPKELDEAKKLLLDLAPHVLALDSDTYQDKLSSEEAVLCLGWTGPLVELRANPDTADTKYVVPSEGTLFWMDAWVMMADAPHPNATYAWFDFIERPDIQALETTTTGYATPNLEAKKLVPQEMLDDPAVFPPEDVMANLEGADPASTDNADRLAVWTEFKSSLGG